LKDDVLLRAQEHPPDTMERFNGSEWVAYGYRGPDLVEQINRIGDADVREHVRAYWGPAKVPAVGLGET